jgi:hypothetical protein
VDLGHEVVHELVELVKGRHLVLLRFEGARGAKQVVKLGLG